MDYFKKNISDFIIIIVFFFWAIIDLFSLIPEYQFIIDIGCSIVFVILFEFSLKSTKDKNSRYNSLVKSIFLFTSILIATSLIIHYRDLAFCIKSLEVVNIVLPVQSMIYLYYYRKKNKY